MNIDRPIEVPQTDPKAGYLAHQAEIDSAIQRVLNSGWYILGREVEYFEQEFAAYIGVHHAIGVANGTDALELSLRACGVGSGDLVFTVSHTAVATVAAIELVGAIPVLVDIDPITYTMDPNSLEAALARSPAGTPKAVIPVHLYGHPANMQAILSISKRHGLYAIEDCAQAHGAKIGENRVGSFGDLAAFSFYPTKNLGAFGDGGVVVTNNRDLRKKLMALRQYGWEKRYVSSFPGINSRLDELQAAILRIKLKYLDSDNAERRKIAHTYTRYFRDRLMSCPEESDDISHVYHQYVVRTEDRASLINHLNKNLIGSAIHYPLPVHMQPAYKNGVNVMYGDLPSTESIYMNILSLPIYPQLSTEQIDCVVSAVLAW